MSCAGYGGCEPGLGLPEGGEIRHENVRILGLPVQTWIMVYQYTSTGPTAPFAAADPPDGSGPFGFCVDERSGSPTWPFTAITNATYNDLSTVSLTGAGITGSLDITKTDPPNTTGNSTFRTYDYTYGGGAPGDPPMGFNGTLTAAMSTADTDYTLDIGEGAPMTYHMPAAFTAPLGIGGSDTVMIPNNQDLVLSWTQPADDINPDGSFTNNTYFNFTFFADPTSANPPQFICLTPPTPAGGTVTFTVPKAVISVLPAAGLIVNANLSHVQEARDLAGTDTHRFDLVSIYCNISKYAIQ